MRHLGHSVSGHFGHEGGFARTERWRVYPKRPKSSIRGSLNRKWFELNADTASPLIQHVQKRVSSKNPVREVGLSNLFLFLGTIVYRLCENIDHPRSHVPNTHCMVGFGRLEEAEAASMFSECRPNILAQPRPPDSLLETSRFTVELSTSLDPEDAFEMTLPALSSSVDHLIRAHHQDGGKELNAVLVGGEPHGLLQVLQRLVIILHGWEGST